LKETVPKTSKDQLHKHLVLFLFYHNLQR